jgi:hypothetical protein
MGYCNEHSYPEYKDYDDAVSVASLAANDGDEALKKLCKQIEDFIDKEKYCNCEI